MKRIRAKRRTRSTKGKRICGTIWVVVIYAAFATGAIASFTSSSIFSDSLKQLQSGTTGMLDDAVGVLDSFSPAIGSAFDSVKTLVTTTVDSVTNVIDFNDLERSGLSPNMHKLADGLDLCQNNIGYLIANGTLIQTAKANLTTKVIAMSVTVDEIANSIASWSSSSSPLPIGSSATYYLSSAVVVPSIQDSANETKNGLQSAPDGSSAMAPLTTSPNLSQFATEIRSLLNSISVSITTEIRKGSESVKTNTVSALDTGKAVANGPLKSGLDPIKSSIGDFKSSLISGLQNVGSYDNYRFYAISGLSAMILLILIILGITMCLKKPSRAKGCNLCATPFYFLIQLLALTLFLISLGLGEVCDNVFNQYPSPLLQGSAYADTQKIFFNARDNCLNNKSVFITAFDLKLVDADTANLTKIATEKLDAIDFSGLSDQFNLSSTINLSESPSSKMDTLNTLDLSSLDVTTLNTIHDTTLPSLLSQLNSLKATLQALSSALNAGALTFDPNPQDPLIQQNAVDDLKARIANVMTKIDTLTGSNTGTIATIDGDIVSMNSTVVDLLKTAQNVKVNYYNQDVWV
jgi:hypothetical protein